MILTAKTWTETVVAIGLLAAVGLTALAPVISGRTLEWFEALVAGLTLLWIASTIIERRFEMTVPQVAAPIAAIILLGLAQCMSFSKNGQSVSIDVDATWDTVGSFIFLLSFLIIATNSLLDPRRALTLVNSLALYGLAIAGLALLFHFSGSSSDWFGNTADCEGGICGPFPTRNQFSGYMVLLIPLPTSMILAGTLSQKWQLIYGVAAATMAVATIESLSRGGVLSLISEMIFLALVTFRVSRSVKGHWLPRRSGVLAIIICSVVLAVLLASARPVVQRFTNTVDQMRGRTAKTDFTTGRRAIWHDTFEIIKSHPLFGIGLGAYATAYRLYGHPRPYEVRQAHNDYLQVIADCGIAGGLIAVWFLASVFRTIVRSIRAHGPVLKGLAIGSAASLFGILIHSLVDFNLQLLPHAALFLLLLALTSSIATTSRFGMVQG
jgi:O-antigen ligase